MSEMFCGVSNDSSMPTSTQQVKYKKSTDGNIDYYGVEGFFHTQDEPGLAMSQHQIYQQQDLKEFGILDDLYLDVVTPPSQSCEDEPIKMSIEPHNTDLSEPTRKHSSVCPHKSFQVLRKYRRKYIKVDGKFSSAGDAVQHTHGRGTTSATEKVIETAAEKFIQSMSQSSRELTMLNHPYLSSILTHPNEDSEEVQLIQNLLYCVEKVAENEYDHAVPFLLDCDRMSSCIGTPIQRLAFYFSEALFERISVESGRTIQKDREKKPEDPPESVMIPNLALQVSFHRQYPLSQIIKIVGVQAILDHLEEARKVHIIDLEIRSGVHWITLMQALAARNEHPIEHLKITAVGTKWESMTNEMGRQLTSFAESLNLKFTFNTVFVKDILDLHQNHFELDVDEYLAVYASYIFTAMIGRADRLNHLMIVMRNLSPCVMIVTELEANCNSPTLIGRFVESLFFFGAFFDSLEDCFKNDETSRVNIESSWFRSSIRNILSAEGKERKIRHVDINVWRAFFVRFGLVEMDLSMSSLDQATLGFQSLPCGSSCTLYGDGKCLTLGWKGTPLTSISAWKF